MAMPRSLTCAMLTAVFPSLTVGLEFGIYDSTQATCVDLTGTYTTIIPGVTTLTSTFTQSGCQGSITTNIVQYYTVSGLTMTIGSTSGAISGIGTYTITFKDSAGTTNLVFSQQAAATPTPAGGASAVGDPHLQNIHGERFDLMKAGIHVLINIPRGVSAESALLRVQADALRLGGHCADMYFQELNVTGSWAEAKQAGGYHYSVSQREAKTPEWVAFGKVELKAVHGRTNSGIIYLNMYVKHLGRAGFAVGGLLGEDDHEDASTAPDACAQRLALTVMKGTSSEATASEATASV